MKMAQFKLPDFEETFSSDLSNVSFDGEQNKELGEKKFKKSLKWLWVANFKTEKEAYDALDIGNKDNKRAFGFDYSNNTQEGKKIYFSCKLKGETKNNVTQSFIYYIILMTIKKYQHSKLFVIIHIQKMMTTVMV